MYNEISYIYNDEMGNGSTHVMTLSGNGQVSIPANVRARWNARCIVVVDLGDRVVMRPASEDPVATLRGKYRGAGPSTQVARDRERAADAKSERRTR